jgi:hypothetical protein
MNNSSIFTSDRIAHLKIAAVSLICAAIVAGIGIAARVTDVTSKGALGASTIAHAYPHRR